MSAVLASSRNSIGLDPVAGVVCDVVAATLADREPEFSRAKTSLDEGAYEKAWNVGVKMSADQAVAFALS